MKVWKYTFLFLSLLWTATAGDTLSRLVKGNTAFALDLYTRLAGEDSGNIFFSPLSLYYGLAPAYAGAKGKTEKEMARALRFSLPSGEIHPALRLLMDKLHSRFVKLTIANAIWGERSYKFLPGYVSTVKKYYGEFFPVDFSKSPERIRDRINRWVEEKTSGKIKDLLGPGDIDPLTRLVITNAIYFRGKWASAFDKERTMNSVFYSPSGERKVKMMTQTSRFNYMQVGGKLQVLEMPYQGGDFSMVIFLPVKKNGLPELEKEINPERLQKWLSSLSLRKVRVFIPKFKIRRRYSLQNLFASMGMRSAFSPVEADFSGMSRRKDLFISKVVHEAYVEVDEEGTEAAGATGTVIGVTALPPEPVVDFRADHPFLFIIVHRPTGAVLFMGRMVKP